MLYGATDSISRYRIITGNNSAVKDSYGGLIGIGSAITLLLLLAIKN
jgi:hypothetical protein